MKEKGVSVYFSNTLYIAYQYDKVELLKSEISFLNEFQQVGCFIDKREDFVLDRKYFFNTNLHLNAEGRAIRTRLLIDSIRNSVLSGKCDKLT